VVLVRRLIHPGTVIVIAGLRLEIDTPIPGGQVYLDVAEKRIAISAAP